jgi:hypothetical protein
LGIKHPLFLPIEPNSEANQEYEVGSDSEPEEKAKEEIEGVEGHDFWPRRF